MSNRADFVDQLKTLTQDEHLEILKILKKHNVHHTENQNGVFFPMSVVKDAPFKEMCDFVGFCLENRKTLEARKVELEKYHVDYDGTVHVPEPTVPPMATALGIDTRDAEILRYKHELK
jgi:hypothetical protein